jgi:hypothetical protein
MSLENEKKLERKMPSMQRPFRKIQNRNLARKLYHHPNLGENGNGRSRKARKEIFTFL